MKKKMFDFVIGNPPYNADFADSGENGNYAAPVYDKFMDASIDVGSKIELIHPARFLFNAGSTSKEWNHKMLNDEHFKVIKYEPDSDKVFPSLTTPLKGGVAITYHSDDSIYKPIGIFTPYPELNSILNKAKPNNEGASIVPFIFIQNRFNLNILLGEFPEYKPKIGSNGKDSRFEKNIFEKIPLFTEAKNENCIKVLGIFHNKRTWRYIDKKYVDINHENLFHYKVVIPVANGSGAFGEKITNPVIETPNEAYTRSFIGIGAFDTEFEATAELKYIKTKFCRAMLDILKVTQMTNKDVWKFVPLQNFTSSSDIDWSVSIPEIDKQLYKKYGLSEEEISFIETNVKEMV